MIISQKLAIASASALVCALASCACLLGCASPASQQDNREGGTPFATEAESFSNEVNDTALSDEGPNATESTDTSPTPVALQLESDFASIANSTGMDVSISFVDLTDPRNSCGFNSTNPQRSASTIKLAVLYELLRQASEGLVSLDETYVLTSADIVGGTGVLQGYGAGSAHTFRELAELMINQSDNTATNVIIDRVGMGNVNATAAALGLSSVQLDRRMMDTAALAAGIDNYLSAQDATTLLKMIDDGTFVNQQMSDFALSALRSQSDYQGILGGLPAGTTFAHKTGTLSNAQNDCGIVLGEHPYALAAFCQAGPSGYFSQAEAFNVMARVAQCVTAALG